MKRIGIILIVLLIPSAVFADELLDEWYGTYHRMKEMLNVELVLDPPDEGSVHTAYTIKMDIPALLDYASILTNEQLKQACSIAREMTCNTDLPPIRALYTEEGLKIMAKAIMTLEAETIIEICEQLLESDRLYV